MEKNCLIDVKLLFFAKSREISGLSETNYKIETTCGQILAYDLLNNIIDKFNLHLIKNNLILAVNEEFCENLNNTIFIKNGDEIAIIPPLSGG